MRLEGIEGVSVLQPQRHVDARGYFCEVWRAGTPGLPAFVQDNESLSSHTGTIRGLHFQTAPYAQAKLVRCVRGGIIDVAVDIRRGSPTFGRHVAHELNPENGRVVFVPTGFAHGFVTLQPETLVQYKVSAPYAPDHAHGLAWDDPALAIAWPLQGAPVLSERDRGYPTLSELPAYFD